MSVRLTPWREVVFVSPMRWKVHFLSIAAILFFTQFALGVHDARRDLLLEPFNIIPFLIVCIFCSCLVAGCCWLLDLPRRSVKILWVSVIWFALNLILSTLLLELMRAKVFPLPFIAEPIHAYSTWRVIAILISDVLTSFVIVILVDALSRVLDERRRKAEDDARQAARFQQQLLLSEEESRALVSRYLHDNVQAQMIRLGAQLGQLAERLPSHDAAIVSSVRDVLEEVRGIDVQGAARALSPNLEASGLTECLRQLASHYASITEVTIHIDSSLDRMDKAAQFQADGPSINLAIFRIVEQALLNSVKHGQAKSITINIEKHLNSRVVIDIRDDGTSDPHKQGPSGGGLATIDGWAQVFDGSWNLKIMPDLGASLRVDLFWTD